MRIGNRLFRSQNEEMKFVIHAFPLFGLGIASAQAEAISVFEGRFLGTAGDSRACECKAHDAGLAQGHLGG